MREALYLVATGRETNKQKSVDGKPSSLETCDLKREKGGCDLPRCSYLTLAW